MLLPFLRNKTPWILGEAERELFEKHHFYPYLRRNQFDFQAFVARFGELDNHFWNSAKKWLPPEWWSNQTEEIKQYLGAIVEHRKTFAEELTKILLP